MKKREGFKVVSVTIPNAWIAPLDKSRKECGNTRSAEIRQALRERLIRRGYGAKVGGGKDER